MQIIISFYLKHHLDLKVSESLLSIHLKLLCVVSVAVDLTASRSAALAPFLVHLLQGMLVFLWAEL